MWRGTAILGNRTRFGRGKRGISIKSYEEFFVLTGLVDRTAVSSEKEGAKTTAKSLCQRGNFAGGAHDRILNDLHRLIDAVHHIFADAIEPCELNIQSLARVRHHGFDSSELVAGRQSDLNKIRRSNTQVFSNGSDRQHHFARFSHETLDLL